jgi:hypothetical protein
MRKFFDNLESSVAPASRRRFSDRQAKRKNAGEAPAPPNPAAQRLVLQTSARYAA